jgi:hypothetical protein
LICCYTAYHVPSQGHLPADLSRQQKACHTPINRYLDVVIYDI